MSIAKRLLALRMVRFCIVAGLCMLLQLALMLGLVATGIDSLLANGVSFVVSSQVSFALSAVFTYRDREIIWSQTAVKTRWLLFNATATCALVANEVSFALSENELGHLPAFLCATLSGGSISLFIGNKAIFNSKGNTTMSTVLDVENQAVASLLRREGVAFFLPACNEAENLPTVVGSIFGFFKGVGCPFTIFIVNDGSTDNTVEVTKGLEQLYGSHVVAIHQSNRGYGGALRTGIDYSLMTSHGLIAFSDADGQFDITSIRDLVWRLIEDKADLSIGIRVRRADPFGRRLMGRSWHLLCRALLGYKAKDVDCGFKVFTRHMLEEIGPKLCGEHAAISPEILARAKHAKFTITEAAVDHHERSAGKQTGANLKVVLTSIRQLLELRRLINAGG